MDSKTLATLAFLDAFGAEQSLLTYFADLSGPALRYFPTARLGGAVRTTDCFLPIGSPILSTGQTG